MNNLFIIMRGVKKNISLEVDSALALMQEIYNDVVENRNTASIIMKKMLSFMKDAEDMSVIGPVIKEQQKVLNDLTEKKISLVKLQAALLKQTQGSGNGGQSMGKLTLTDEDRELLDKLVNDSSSNDKTENYKV